MFSNNLTRTTWPRSEFWIQKLENRPYKLKNPTVLISALKIHNFRQILPKPIFFNEFSFPKMTIASCRSNTCFWLKNQALSKPVFMNFFHVGTTYDKYSSAQKNCMTERKKLCMLLMHLLSSLCSFIRGYIMMIKHILLKVK